MGHYTKDILILSAAVLATYWIAVRTNDRKVELHTSATSDTAASRRRPRSRMGERGARTKQAKLPRNLKDLPAGARIRTPTGTVMRRLPHDRKMTWAIEKAGN